MPRRLLAVFLLAAAGWAAPPYKERWVTKYFFDEEASSLVITDFQFPSPKRGVASGFINKGKDKPKPVMLVTSDQGERWSLVPVKEVPRSIYFLDEFTGWFVGEKSIWKTEESGRSWQKLNNAPKEMTRVWFLSRERGWAVGGQKQVFETSDGGETWKPLAAAALPKMNPDFSSYSVISFADKKIGMIAGWSDPPRRGELPGWMDPAKSRDRPQWPTTMALLQTVDGGDTWSASTASIFGQMTQVSFAPNGLSLGLIEFKDNFAFPSEVFLASRGKNGKNERVFREANRAITDVLIAPGGVCYLAGTEVTGTVRDSPIPGKLKILKSSDLKSWTEMPVDYRADAHRAMLTAPDAENVWVATDTGMLLKLVREP